MCEIDAQRCAKQDRSYSEPLDEKKPYQDIICKSTSPKSSQKEDPFDINVREQSQIDQLFNREWVRI